MSARVNPGVPLDDWARLCALLDAAELHAAEGFVGTAGCALEAAERRVLRAEEAGEPWAPLLRAAWERAAQELRARYGPLE